MGNLHASMCFNTCTARHLSDTGLHLFEDRGQTWTKRGKMCTKHKSNIKNQPKQLRVQPGSHKQYEFNRFELSNSRCFPVSPSKKHAQRLDRPPITVWVHHWKWQWIVLVPSCSIILKETAVHGKNLTLWCVKSVATWKWCHLQIT